MRHAHGGMDWWVGLAIGMVTFLVWARFTFIEKRERMWISVNKHDAFRLLRKERLRT